jgi:hypothetical protein
LKPAQQQPFQFPRFDIRAFLTMEKPLSTTPFTLSTELDIAAIDAHLTDGLLRLRIPKVAEALPSRIEARLG